MTVSRVFFHSAGAAESCLRTSLKRSSMEWSKESQSYFRNSAVKQVANHPMWTLDHLVWRQTRGCLQSATVYDIILRKSTRTLQQSRTSFRGFSHFRLSFVIWFACSWIELHRQALCILVDCLRYVSLSGWTFQRHVPWSISELLCRAQLWISVFRRLQ